MKVANDLSGVSSESSSRLGELRCGDATGRISGPLASEVGR